MKLPQKRDRIVHDYETYNFEHLSDVIAATLAEVEEGFRVAGLVCEDDYTAKDLIEFARALVASRVVEVQKKGKSYFEKSSPTE